MPDGKVAGLDTHTTIVATEEPISSEAGLAARAVIIEVVPSHSGSIDRLRRLIDAAPNRPVIAAVDKASVAEIRMLMRENVEDIIQLPLTRADLNSTIEPILRKAEERASGSERSSQIIVGTKCRGGIGATTILTQLGCLMANRPEEYGRTCLVDLDVQFGNAALYLGRLPSVGVKDLLDAGLRADSAMTDSMAAHHDSGLHYFAAPSEIMPLNAIDSDQVLFLLDLLASEYDTILVDLPMSWTNWSLSVLARSDAVLMVGELTVASLHQAKRQIDFMREQQVLDSRLQIIMNRTEKRIFKTIGYDDAAEILGEEVAFDIADEPRIVQSALDQGVLISEIEARSKAARDLTKIADALPALREARA
ncbi:AAA family ATPase [Parasphingopyxis sp. CP4]|uniref:AAA family ATPase n=1 Tax=Parasphingopyxis sp. CP4 TaxID=2724527 RepID=UPI0015A31DA4|nr:AAA family ATPase [Parasphingopyxis sp. CP4]QLC22444.1 AAA family ATPase [Parasphingopyxis sp. CP4]